MVFCAVHRGWAEGQLLDLGADEESALFEAGASELRPLFVRMRMSVAGSGIEYDIPS